MQEQMFAELLTFLFGTTVVISVSRLLVRYIDGRRRIPTPPAMDRQLDERLARLEQIAESTAIEVERISEAQRFTTKLLSERAAGAAEFRSIPRVITPH